MTAGSNWPETRAKTGLPFADGDLEAARHVTKEGYAGSTAEEFTDAERATLRRGRRGDAAHASAEGPPLTSIPWSFIKVSDAVEGGLSHSRGGSIVLSHNRLQRIMSAAKSQLDEPAPVVPVFSIFMKDARVSAETSGAFR